ncbi:PAS domain S-box protein [Bacillus sp. MUM 13]|uniref:PAS domain S-box protein n=1 Tax=Bacillus sp. MUM 13 TaxID=1678001 RepID=UPI0008F5C065|nr:PAS domain S-box protein [Bacillus sp. MUM 13]OIK13464.1 hypothetical protein BIV59_05850 [Bacillus sp. MUM 13]
MIKHNNLLIYILLGIAVFLLFDFCLLFFVQQLNGIAIIQFILSVIFIVFSGIMLHFFIAARKKSDGLDEDQQRLQTLINSMVDFVNFKDGNGRWIEANDFGRRLFELEHVDYKGKKDSELANYTSFYNEALLYCEVSDEETWKKGHITRCEEKIPLPDGEIKTFDTIKVPLFHEDGSRRALVVIGRDITERVKAEKRLSDSQQQYKSLFDYNPDPVFMMDLHGNITNVNPKFRNITGPFHNQLSGACISDFIADTEDRINLKRSIDQVKESKAGITSGDFRFNSVNDEVFLLSCTFVPILIDGEMAGIIGYAKDVTAIRETEAILRKTEKLSVVGELAASVAHEVRNPLTSLKGFVQLLKDNETQYQNYYSIMLSELDRINQIVSELLVLAKPQESHFKKHNLIQLLRDVNTLLEPEAAYYSSELLINAKNSVPPISCEANGLKQVFINIIKNSIEASSRHIWIDFNTKGGWVIMTIKDDGCGIEEDRVRHLGEPFYSSKEKGTGLGLTVSYRIIEAHKGKMTFQSEIGKGTEVQICLPIH